MNRGVARGAAAVAVLLVAASLTACTADAGGDASAPADASDIPQAALDVMNGELYESSRWQIYVEDLETGDVLVDYFGDAMAEPGSFVKSYSTGAAWLEFGSDSTLTTPVKRTGEVVEGTLQGDLVLVGKGDLTMGGRTKPDGTVDFANLDHNDANPLPGATLTPEDPLTGLDELAAQVKHPGIDTVSGEVDRRRPPVPGRARTSSPSPRSIINQNIIDVTDTPGAAAASPPRASMTSGGRAVDAHHRGRDGGRRRRDRPKSEVEGRPQDGQVVLSGTIAADADPVLKV